MDKKLKNLIKIALILIIAYLAYLMFPGIKSLLKFMLKLVLPFLIGFVGAFVLLPCVEWFMKKKISRRWSVVITCIIFFGLFATLIIIIVPLITKQVGLLINAMPSYIVNVSDFLNKISDRLDFLPDKILPTPDNLELFFTTNLTRILNYLINIVQSIFSYLLVIVISPILMVYFLLDFDKIIEWLKKKTGENDDKNLLKMFVELKNAMRDYFKGVFIVIFILSATASLCFMFAKIDFAFLWGLIVGITNVIPYIGPYLGGAIVVLFVLSSSPQKALIVLIIIVVLQLIESNFLTPNIQSKSIKTHPILVLFSLAFFGEILGIFGLLLAVPALCIIQIVIKYKFFVKKAK